MLTEVKAVIDRSSATIMQDVLGVVTLFAMLFVGLSLPGVF